MNLRNKVQVEWKWRKTECQLRIGHQVQTVCVHEDGWTPKRENQSVQEAEQVVTLVLVVLE